MHHKDFATGVVVGAVAIALAGWLLAGRTGEPPDRSAAALHEARPAPDRSHDDGAALCDALSRARQRIHELEIALARSPMQTSHDDSEASAAPSDDAPAIPEAADVLARLNAAFPFTRASDVARELARLPAPDLLRILRTIWNGIADERVQRVLLEALPQARPQLAVQILALGTTSPKLHDYALARLTGYAFIDFMADPNAYPAWAQRFADRPTSEVLAASAHDWVQRLRGLDDGARRRRLEDSLFFLFDGDGPLHASQKLPDDVVAELRNAGFEDVLSQLLTSHDDEARTTAWQWLAKTSVADEDFVRRYATPLAENLDDLPRQIQRGLLATLAAQHAPWSDALLRDALQRQPLSHAGAIADALAKAGDLRAIPTMIGKIVAEGSEAAAQAIGRYGLEPLTGVPYDASHDGTWWLTWWNENRWRLPEPIRAQPIPR